MKVREDQLLEQLSVMKQQLYLKTNSTTGDLTSKVTRSGVQYQSSAGEGSRAESSVGNIYCAEDRRNGAEGVSGFTLSQQPGANEMRNQQSAQLQQLRVGELEAVIFRQHEQLINLEESNIGLKFEL